MKKSIFDIIDESFNGSAAIQAVAAVDLRSVMEITNEGIAAMNGILSESTATLSVMNEDLITAMIQNESAEVDSLNEGIMQNIGKSIKAFFEQVKKVVKAIIDRIKFELAAFKKNGAKLASTYADRAKKANLEGVEVMGYNYSSAISTWATDGSGSGVDKVEAAVVGIQAKVEGYLSGEVTKEKAAEASTKFEKEVIRPIKEELSKAGKMRSDVAKAVTKLSFDANATSLSDIKTAIMNKGRGESVGKVVIKLSTVNIDNVIAAIKDGNDLTKVEKMLSKFESDLKDMANSFDTTISRLEKIEVKAGDDAATIKNEFVISKCREYVVQAKQKLNQIYQTCLAVNNAVIALLTEEYNQNVRIFAAAYRKGGGKVKAQNNSVESAEELENPQMDEDNVDVEELVEDELLTEL